ncbi:hypothetical protein KR093_004836 [Drosophila rubida]|uniref:Uncharacterized protein n=1 Tax=Drosophila rubida TaxID=30044 RepID=A0AAD4JZE1_9MUSC|nr:hypothetical protein KR093_004836 [Drosophila rubida]
MSDGEIKYISKDCVKSDGVIKMGQENGKRSFLITVDDNGKIEVSPKNLNECCPQSQCNQRPKKELSRGKQRIRIALIEEDANASSDGEQDADADANEDVVSIDAQSFDVMHDRFVKIYNKNVHGKPSFVVLEDALMRKRIEETLQDHYDRTSCNHHHQHQHCHAQQQTSPCDIGAHTGSQTDEFLLHCAMRSHLPGHSRGCQATDHNDHNAELSHRASSSSNKKHLQVPSLRRLNQMRSLPFNHQSLSTSTLAAPVASAPHVTISFAPPTAATMPVVLQPQPQPQSLPQSQSQAQPLQVQQAQQQQLLLPTATHSYCSCCANLQPCISNSCNNCCLQMPAKNHYYLPATNTCFLQAQQQQQPQQQYPAMTTTYGNCSSNCCLLGPSLAQTTLSYGPAMSEQCSHHILETLTQQQCQECSSTNWPMQTCNHCHYYPMSTCSMADFGRSHYASCPMQQQPLQQQPQQQQPQQQQPLQQQPLQQQPLQQQPQQQQQKPHQPQQQPATQQQQVQLLQQQHSQSHHQQSQQPQLDQRFVCLMKGNSMESKSVSMNPPAQLVSKSMGKTPTSSTAKLERIAKKVRCKVTGATTSNKLYMARFGRTCLILKPNICSMPPRLRTRPISRCTSVIALPQK